MKIYLLINKYSSSYMSVKKEEKDLYEKNVIKGESNMVSFIESQVDMMLETLDLKNYKFTVSGRFYDTFCTIIAFYG